MKEIIEFGIVILVLVLMLKVLLTFILDRIFKRADKKELTISLIMIGVVESLIIISSILNLTNKIYPLFYIIFILLMIYLAMSLVFNMLFISRYLLINSSLYLFISLILKFLPVEKTFYNYLRTLILSPLSNTNVINYSMIIITSALVMIISLINVIIKHIKYKKES